MCDNVVKRTGKKKKRLQKIRNSEKKKKPFKQAVSNIGVCEVHKLARSTVSYRYFLLSSQQHATKRLKNSTPYIPLLPGHLKTSRFFLVINVCDALR